MFKKQLHSTDILGYQTGAILQEGDGIFSNQSGVALGLRVADCNVIAIMGKKRFGIIHAGRKGLKDGIIQKMFSQLIEKEETSFSVFIGLSIRKCCYEVGKEFTTYFEPKYLSFIDEEHYMLDMIAVIQDICLQYSINKLHIHLDCTKCSPKFFSYRELGNWDYYNIVMIEKNS